MADEGAQRAAVRPRAVLGADPSPVDRFIAEQIEPRYDERREWPQKHSHLYLLYRAARRSKLHMKKITDSHRIFFYSGVAVGGVEDGVTSLVSHQAHRICRSTALVRRYLKASQLPAPRSKVLHQSQYNTAVRYWESLGRVATVRPAKGQSGRGTTVGVRFEGDLREAWKRASSGTLSPEAGTSAQTEQQILLEAPQTGLDLRTFVVGESVVGALVRVPFYVLGDGESSIGELADAEAARRAEDAETAERLPQITDEFLSDVGLTRSYIPAEGSLHHLTPLADPDYGGALFVDVADQLSEEVRQLAIDGLWAIPGLEAAAVDLSVPDLSSAEGAMVVDIDPGASVADFRYPDYGKYRQPQVAIMEQIIRHAPAR